MYFLSLRVTQRASHQIYARVRTGGGNTAVELSQRWANYSKAAKKWGTGKLEKNSWKKMRPAPRLVIFYPRAPRVSQKYYRVDPGCRVQSRSRS